MPSLNDEQVDVVNGKILDAMEKMADQAKANPDSSKCLQYSEAALNFSQARETLLASTEVCQPSPTLAKKK